MSSNVDNEIVKSLVGEDYELIKFQDPGYWIY